jgi:hypothetical protein
MFIRPKTWKELITTHPSTKETDRNFHIIAEAFNKEKTVIDCTNAALGMSPAGIFLALPIDSPKPILIHHFSKAFRNPGNRHDVDKFFGIISWDDLPLAVKLVPTILFSLAGEGIDENSNLTTHFKDIDTDQLFAAKDPEAFAAVQEKKDDDEKLFMRRCIPVPPFITLMMVE